MDKRIFTFFNDGTNLAIAGEDFIEYKISVSADAGIVTHIQASADFKLKIMNPCVDHDFV